MGGRFEMVRPRPYALQEVISNRMACLAFQTAVALAEHRAEKGEGGKTLLTEDDLREVIELSNSFKTYFEQLHGSEGRRALDRGERLERPPFKLHEQPF